MPHDDHGAYNWFDSEPYGDQLCQCPCGHQGELMPEETDWCADCLAGRHAGTNPVIGFAEWNAVRTDP